ncbi:MAG: hypothetical protein JNK60_09070, partial [Acidobacteria bacterium]|nr:hypothetical protein [Acidobacteriota bacterium]
MKTTLALSLFLIAFPAAHAQTEPPLPLPDAPVQLVIPDPAAADRALTGGFRKALTGTLEETDPVGAALHRTRVGGKLASQWELFTADLSLSWKDLIATRPTSIGFAILAAGDLEAVLALRTPLAALPIPLPPGKAFDHRGVACHLVSRGAGDERTQDRRIGLAWTKTGGTLLLATSERALKLAVDKALANAGVQPFLPGLASLRLDLDALRKDLYFRREFLFAEGSTGPETGVLLAALRDEAPGLVEVREGTAAAPTAPAPRWVTAGRGLAAAGWETDGARLFTALRRGLLETVPSPESRPVQPLKPLPEPNATSPDRYLVDLTKPVALSELGGTGPETGV